MQVLCDNVGYDILHIVITRCDRFVEMLCVFFNVLASYVYAFSGPKCFIEFLMTEY